MGQPITPPQIGLVFALALIASLKPPPKAKKWGQSLPYSPSPKKGVMRNEGQKGGYTQKWGLS
ncbi:hypothetical protein [Helicobacter gastrofelis]|uniref:hypothetical protein n=1 Tax=Helicobacter gastrofelis TaxID=2849642 RepID=UPI001C847049|nr:hypothetical protein [Helicobacter sp. NHP19-012]